MSWVARESKHDLGAGIFPALDLMFRLSSYTRVAE
jgi:hypothetical protein